MSCNPKPSKIHRIENPSFPVEFGLDKNVAERNAILAVEKAFSNSLVWKQLSSFLTHHDLLNCALVNKNWNLHTRYLVRVLRKQMVTINNDCPCRHLKKLDRLLSESFNPPFETLHIQTYQPIYNRQTHECLRGHDVQTLYRNILKCSWKSVKISWTHKSSCGAVQLLLKLLQEKHLDVEQLGIYKLPAKLDLIQALGMSEDQMLQNLRILEVCSKIDFSNVIHHAPNLQEIIGYVTPELLRQLLTMKKTHLVKEFQLIIPSNTYVGSLGMHERTFLEFARTRPSIRRMTLLFHRPLPRKAEVVMEELIDLLSQNSRSSLEYFHGDLIGYLWALTVDWWSLKYLKLNANVVESHNPQGMKLSSISRWENANISTVEIYGNNRRITDEVEFPDPIELITRIRRGSVKELRLNTADQMSPGQLMLLGQAFPNVREIESDHFITRGNIWSLWPSLEYFSFAQASSVLKTDLNVIESCICGISVEEIVHLRSILESDDQVGDLHLVPSKVGMRDTSLRKLRISIRKGKNLSLLNLYSSLPITTLVDHLVFQRMPGLKVQVVSEEMYPNRHEFSSVVELKERYPG